jgi:hypothetical protein
MTANFSLNGSTRKQRRAQSVAWFLAMVGFSVLAAVAIVL